MPKDDANQCLSNTTLLPALLRDMGYSTHALGKWDGAFAPARTQLAGQSSMRSHELPSVCLLTTAASLLDGRRSWLHRKGLYADAFWVRHLPRLLRGLQPRLVLPHLRQVLAPNLRPDGQRCGNAHRLSLVLSHLRVFVKSVTSLSWRKVRGSCKFHQRKGGGVLSADASGTMGECEVDFSLNIGAQGSIQGAPVSLNGTYSSRAFSARAKTLIQSHDIAKPLCVPSINVYLQAAAACGKQMASPSDSESESPLVEQCQVKRGEI